jgi:probable rRNA maturation factor
MPTLDVRLVGDWPADINRAKIYEVITALQQKEAGLPAGSINVKLVDDSEITALNKQYSGNAYATDVLSFSYIENGQEAADGDLGDVAISLSTAQLQAQKAGTDITDEVALLTLHGVLHILGRDHAKPGDEAELDKLQEDIMKAAGLTYRKFNWE